LAPLEVDHQSLEAGIALLAQTHVVDTLSKIMRPSVLLDQSVLGVQREDLLRNVIRVCRCEVRVEKHVRWWRSRWEIIAIEGERRSMGTI
jgi:hypothetical protein